MHRCDQNTLRQIGFGKHRRRKKCRIEHLERDAGCRDADSAQLAPFARRAAARDDAKRFAQIVGYILESHC